MEYMASQMDRQIEGGEQTYIAMCAEINRLKAEAAKSERRAVAFGDVISNQCIAMQAALIEFYVGEGSVPAITWIENTLCGLLPDYEAAQAIGGAQAWFDAKTAEHLAFRASHPGPPAPGIGAA